MKNHMISDDSYCCKSIIPKKKLQAMTSNVGLTISVGDTTMRFTISIEEDN